MRTLPSPPAGQDLNIKALRFRLRVRERLPRRLQSLAPLIAPDPDLSKQDPSLEYIYLDHAVAKIIRPGMKCIDIGAFSGVYTKQFLGLGADTVAIEAYPPAAAELRKRLGRRCRVIEALLADNERLYTISNKAEMRMIGNAPIYNAADSGISGVQSSTYDQ
ncbi:class I SAM-dependent methyltransferase [Rhodopseudomonas sp.]|uniref:class I SAM-dependent methyltransferase n=1 Tax=Rhodopseudomonas sp. TaxID=1078 RepID=UPI003B3A5C58